MVKVKFVEHLMPEILVTNLSGLKHFDPGLTPIEKWHGSYPSICPGTYSFFGWSDWVEFGVIRSSIVQLKILPYEIFWSRASPTRYGPPNSKMVIFGCFWIFRQIEICKWENRRCTFSSAITSFNLIPNLLRLDRAPLSYGPGSGERPENIALTLFGAQIRY